jgi:hypothetical protein
MKEELKLTLIGIFAFLVDHPKLAIVVWSLLGGIFYVIYL